MSTLMEKHTAFITVALYWILKSGSVGTQVFSPILSPLQLYKSFINFLIFTKTSEI